MTDEEVAQELGHLPFPSLERPATTVVGVGGAGINILRGVESDEVRLVAMDTDDAFLSVAAVADQVTLGPSLLEGTGSRGNPALGRAAAEESRAEMATYLEGDVLLLTAGLGRGTGTGAAPVVADAAREAGMTVLACLVWPFDRERRDDVADEGLRALKARCQGYLVVDNEAARSQPAVESHWEAAQLANQLAVGVLEGFARRVEESYPFGVGESVRAFLRQVADDPLRLPLRAGPWEDPLEHATPLAMDPQGRISLR